MTSHFCTAKSHIVMKLCRLSAITKPKIRTNALSFICFKKALCIIQNICFFFFLFVHTASSLFKRICRPKRSWLPWHILSVPHLPWNWIQIFMSAQFGKEAKAGGQLKVMAKKKQQTNQSHECSHCNMQMLFLITACYSKHSFPCGIHIVYGTIENSTYQNLINREIHASDFSLRSTKNIIFLESYSKNFKSYKNSWISFCKKSYFSLDILHEKILVCVAISFIIS